MLRASLAERLGRITAAEAEQREDEERRTIDRRLHLLGADVWECESPVERALRRKDAGECTLARPQPMPERWWVQAWCGQDARRFGGALDAPRRCSRASAGHKLVMAPQVRAYGVAMLWCGEEMRNR